MLVRKCSLLVAALLATFAIGAGGCVSRSIIAFDDHPKHPVTHLEVSEVSNYYVFKTGEHRFQTCIDTGDKLVCKRDCGGKTNLECPLAVGTGVGAFANTR